MAKSWQNARENRATIVVAARYGRVSGAGPFGAGQAVGVIMRKVLLCIGLTSLVSAAGCVASYNQTEQARRQDFDNCTVFGAQPQSLALAECMALQSQRRELAIQRQNDITARNNDYIAARTY
jgi:hypothetical protein